jgi:hypothetical protein
MMAVRLWFSNPQELAEVHRAGGCPNSGRAPRVLWENGYSESFNVNARKLTSNLEQLTLAVQRSTSRTDVK